MRDKSRDYDIKVLLYYYHALSNNAMFASTNRAAPGRFPMDLCRHIERNSMDSLNPQDSKIHVVAKSATPRGEPIALNEVAVLLNPHDDVAIARRPLGRG